MAKPVNSVADMTGKSKGALIAGIALLILCGYAIADHDQPSAAAASTTGSARSFASVPTGFPAPSPSPAQATAQSAADVSGSAGAAVVVKRVAVKQKLSYGKRTIKDSSLAKGTTKVTKGKVGVRVKTYEYRYQNGQMIQRTLLSSVVAEAPVDQITRVGTKVIPKPLPSHGSDECDPNYSGCVPIASDVDCAGGSGNGPAYVSGPVRVIGDDIYDLDRDNDGVGCE